ncbi:MAG: GNAT family N-acetyltransferase [Bacteroidota bacterium]
MDLSEYPKKKTLKDNTEIILRPMVREDKDELLHFFRSLSTDDRLFLKDDVTKEEVIKAWADNIDYSKVLPILAIADNNKIVGDATLHRTNFGWSRHTGEIRMVITSSFQKKGLGTVLARELVDHAVNFGLDIITAQMAAKQISAINAFKKLGFVQEAILKNHVMDLRGEKSNLVIMSNDVSQLWKKMEEMLMDWYPID